MRREELPPALRQRLDDLLYDGPPWLEREVDSALDQGGTWDEAGEALEGRLTELIQVVGEIVAEVVTPMRHLR